MFSQFRGLGCAPPRVLPVLLRAVISVAEDLRQLGLGPGSARILSQLGFSLCFHAASPHDLSRRIVRLLS